MGTLTFFLRDMSDREVINSPTAGTPLGPYSHANRAGGMLFISGNIGDVKEDISLQTSQVLDKIDAILKLGGSSRENVVKCTIFLTNLNDYDKVNSVYGKYFDSKPPARECVQVSRLPAGAKVEISAIAVCSPSAKL